MNCDVYIPTGGHYCKCHGSHRPTACPHFTRWQKVKAFGAWFRFAAIAACLVVLIWLAVGCQTLGVKADQFPDGMGAQCDKARTEAVSWYRSKYRQEPAIRPVKVMLTDNPPQGNGGITRGSGGGYVIELWRNQKPFYGSLVHEMRHCLCLASGKGGGEDAVK